MQDIQITHVINVSITGERTPFLNKNDDEHFLRIPINDCLNAKLLPYLDQAYVFIEKARVSHGRVFIHCLAGISRSPTLAIAYIMRYLNLSVDDGYKHVKQRRPQISPNFNFMGQLSEYERSQALPPTITPIVKCIAIESPFIDRCHTVQVKGRSSTDNVTKDETNSISRPTALFSPLSMKSNLSVESSESKSLLKPKLMRPNNISLKCSMVGLINSSCEELNDTKQIETVPKSADTSSIDKRIGLVNTYYSEPTSSQECQSSQSSDLDVDIPKSNVLNPNLGLLVS